MSDKARRALTDYYAHMNRESNGYARETITGKMVKGNIGNGNPGSTIPKGVKMTDPEFLKFINKMDLILDCMDNEAYEYVVNKYKHGMTNSQITEITGYKKGKCVQVHMRALSYVDVKL